jgi:hypothetical protein
MLLGIVGCKDKHVKLDKAADTISSVIWMYPSMYLARRILPCTSPTYTLQVAQ